MPTIGRSTKSVQLAQLTDEQIKARWAALLPKFKIGLTVCLVAAVGIYMLNHFLKPAQRVTDIANVAFQIASVFSACFIVLTIAGYYFRSDAWTKKSR